MGTVRKVNPVKPICAVTFSQDIILDEVIKKLEMMMGPVEDRTDVFDFSFTTYYSKEMGNDLKKVFLSFEKTMHPNHLPKLKCLTNRFEQKMAVRGKRRVNCDPGYITAAKVVMASAKDFAHRVFLSDGIYGDVQLQFRGNRFRIQDWTFPDYQTELVLDFFHRVRRHFVREGKCHD